MPLHESEDATLIGRMAQIHRRLNPRNYKEDPDYKTGPEWLAAFMARPDDARRPEYQLEPNQELVEIALRNTMETHLGFVYDKLLREKARTEGEEEIDTPGLNMRRVSHIREWLAGSLDSIQAQMADLQHRPETQHAIGLISVTAPTMTDAERMFYREVSGNELQWHLTTAEDVEPPVKRAALLSALNFAVGTDNMVSTKPNFAVRVSNDGSEERTLQLHWGWGNPHIFYGVDITRTNGKVSTVTINDKIIVASADQVAAGFHLLDTFPQDLVYKVPAQHSERDR